MAYDSNRRVEVCYSMVRICAALDGDELKQWCMGENNDAVKAPA